MDRKVLLGKFGEKVVEERLRREGYEIIVTDEMYYNKIGRYTKKEKSLKAFDIMVEKDGVVYSHQVKFRSRPEKYIEKEFKDDIIKLNSPDAINFARNVREKYGGRTPEEGLRILEYIEKNYGESLKRFDIVGIPRENPAWYFENLGEIESLRFLDELTITADPFYNIHVDIFLGNIGVSGKVLTEKIAGKLKEGKENVLPPNEKDK